MAEFRGLYISDEEVDGLLTKQDEAAGGGAAEFESKLEEIKNQTQQRVIETLRAGSVLRLPHLSAAFNLSRFEVDLLLLALAPEFDPRYQKIYAYLQDDVTRKRATVNLALHLFCATLEERIQARDFFSESSALLRHSLLTLHEDAGEKPAPLPNRSLRIDDRIAAFLLGSDRPDEKLVANGLIARAAAPRAESAEAMFPAIAAEKMQRIFALAVASPPLICLLHGPEGAGKKSLAETACRSTGRLLLIVDLALLLRSGIPLQSLLRTAIREALLYGATIYIDGWHELMGTEPAHSTSLQIVEREIERFPGLVFLGSCTPWQPSGSCQYRFVSVELECPKEQSRRELWQLHLSNGIPAREEIDTYYLASAFRFTGGQIRKALDHAKTQAWLREGDDYQVNMKDLLSACRAQSERNLVSFARKITPKRVWADIVLPKDTLAQLLEFCQQIRFRVRVYDEWGFGQKLSLGKGILALFTGSSGTGKTLSAEILANELGLDLYRVDLSCVVSKYIGETEKNLSRVFDDAEQSNAILFFDEADALFGKRSEVKDAHDRYANIEINYLLQRVESYEGVIILASNLSKNIDAAFLRRLHFSIDFPFPDESQRLRIWRGIFPHQAPLASDIEFDFLARKFKIAGGNIKNVALAAAFLAAADGGLIRMDHIVSAVKREYQKLGKVCDRTEFEKYYELVR